jgi:hypothetical protein
VVVTLPPVIGVSIVDVVIGGLFMVVFVIVLVVLGELLVVEVLVELTVAGGVGHPLPIPTTHK